MESYNLKSRHCHQSRDTIRTTPAITSHQALSGVARLKRDLAVGGGDQSGARVADGRTNERASSLRLSECRFHENTVGQNNQEYRLEYWATRSSVRSFAPIAHSWESG